MATPDYVAQSTHLFGKTRYDQPFEVMRGYLNETYPTSPSGATFLMGTVVDLDPVTGYLVVAASGTRGIGVALQNVLDLTAANGYRNLNKTDVNRGDYIGVMWGYFQGATAIHEGSGDIKDYAWWDGTTLQFDSTLPSGVQGIGKLIRGDGGNIKVGVNSTAGSTTTASAKKAIVQYDIRLSDVGT